MVHERLEVKAALMVVEHCSVHRQCLPNVKVHCVDEAKCETRSVLDFGHLCLENITFEREEQIEQLMVPLVVRDPDQFCFVLIRVHIWFCYLQDFFVVHQNEAQQLEKVWLLQEEHVFSVQVWQCAGILVQDKRAVLRVFENG